VTAEQVNMATDLALCSFCTHPFKVSENIDLAAVSAEALRYPAKGAWFRKEIDRTVIGASTRSPAAFFLDPFMRDQAVHLRQWNRSAIWHGSFAIIVRSILLAFCIGSAVVISSCGEKIVYWKNLPPPSTARVVWVKGDNEAVTRAVRLATKLVAVKPVPASTIFVMTNEYRYRREKLDKIPELAHTSRCGVQGEQKHETLPPSAACIWLPGLHIDRLSEEALAAIIAHEIGHIEKGHRTWEGVSEPKLIQWEADEAATDRLNLAGYCASQAMRKYAAEVVSSFGGRLVHPWRTLAVDCKPK
jgi:hypothetical protein